jgi:signal peptidase I
LDDVPELLVPPDRLVVLGDNRDNSADSRVPRTSGGLGLVPRGDVIGRTMFIHWSADRTRIGTPLN